MSNLHHMELPFCNYCKSVHLACRVKYGWITATPKCFSKKEDRYFVSLWPLVMEVPWSITDHIYERIMSASFSYQKMKFHPKTWPQGKKKGFGIVLVGFFWVHYWGNIYMCGGRTKIKHRFRKKINCSNKVLVLGLLRAVSSLSRSSSQENCFLDNWWAVLTVRQS